MPFKKSTPTAINERIQNEINAASPNGDARLRNSVENVVGKTIALASVELRSFIEYLFAQIHVMTADEENLARHASEWGIERKQPSLAVGKASVTGIDGSIIVAGTILQRNDQVQYVLLTDATISGGTGSLIIKAVEAGISGNCPVGTKLNFISPVNGVQSLAVVADDGSGSGITAGADIEDVELWRGRILDRIQNPAQGGAKKDYEKWAKEVPGVTRAWPYPLHDGVGSVYLTFVMDGKPGTIIPSLTEVANVQAYLEVARPTTAEVTVFAPEPVPVNFEIHLNPNTVEVQNAIKAELAAFFRREAVPGDKLLISRIREAISTAAGEFDHELVTPTANIISDFGDLPVLGTFTWGTLV